MPSSRRHSKYNAQLQRVLGQLINRHCDFPHSFLVTVTRVETSGNLRHSSVWVSVCPARYREIVEGTLARERRTLQHLLRRCWRAHPVPQISFHIDSGPAKAERVDKILRKLKKQQTKGNNGRS